jgi:hypothetical protein
VASGSAAAAALSLSVSVASGSAVGLVDLVLALGVFSARAVTLARRSLAYTAQSHCVQRILLVTLAAAGPPFVWLINPSLLFHISPRLEDSRKPFGGLAILLVGDFFQLTPVLGTSLFKAAIPDIPDRMMGTPFQLGVDFLSKFKMITLTEQFRSETEDPFHMQTNNRMRTAGNTNLIDAALLPSLKALSREDVENAKMLRMIMHGLRQRLWFAVIVNATL